MTSRRSLARDTTVLRCIENKIELNWPACQIQFRFFVPDNRPRDTCNLIQQEKPTIDGIVDSGLIPGDHWQVAKILEPIVEIDRERPRVEVLLVKNSS
ncbi:MAG: hypothetical protein R3C03_24145 [Pirellulaceae bacterium]